MNIPFLRNWGFCEFASFWEGPYFFKGNAPWASWMALLSRPSKWTRRVWVANCCWPPLATRGTPEKQTAGTVTASHKMLTPASTFERSHCRHCKERLPGPRRGLLGDLRQSVPQNGRVHLHIVDFTFKKMSFRGAFKTPSLRVWDF